MDVGLPKEFDKRPGSETSGQREAAADAQGRKQLCRALQKLAVLSEAGHEAETSTQGVGVRTRMLDKAVHQDEYRIQEKSKERL